MKENLDSSNKEEKNQLFDLIDNYKYKELSSYIQQEDNKIWNIFIEDNKNCLHYTCEKGNEKMAIFVITQLKIRLGLNSNFENINDNFSNNLNILKYFINSKTKKEGYTPLHYAILSFNTSILVNSQENINFIKFLLLNHSDHNIKTGKNQNLLHLCAISNNSNALVLFKEKYLLNINEKDDQMKTPLHYSIEKNNYEILNILINYENIDINSKDKDGNTPIHYAIFNNNERAIKKLIQYHADINIKNKENKTPLELGLNSKNKKISNIFTKKTLLQQLFFEQTIKKGETNIIKMIFFFLIHIFSFYLNFFLLMPCYSERNDYINVIYIFISAVTFVYYFILFYSNPGYQDNSNNSKYSNLLEVLEDKKDVINYCPLSFILIEGNSKFCLICQKYIKGFNHHCYWVGNCIGENNFNKFMTFLIICIINTGYNLILVIIYFSPRFIKYLLNLDKESIIYDNDNNDNHFYTSNSLNVKKEIDGNFNLMKGIRGCLGIIGIYIGIVFLSQLIELFKYHYNSYKEKLKFKKKINYI